MRDHLSFALVTVLSFACPVDGQWSSDPAVNLAIADRAGEQTQVRIAPTADGGAYVSWFDNAGGGYDVYLQRLDAGGHEQWAHNGVLIADRSFSSTQAYDLAVDTAGHAVLAFRDDRPVGIQVTVTRVDETGSQVWGAAGVQVTGTTDFIGSPRIAATSDGFIVAAWTQDDDAVLQKLDAAGVVQWGAGVTLSDSGGSSFAPSDLNTSDGGAVIVSLVRGFIGATYYAQKLSAAGAQVWGTTPIAVFDGGSLQIANFPTFVPDGSGGAVFGWYGTGPLQCYVQHVLANGSEVFAHDGVAASTNPAQVRVSPSVSYDPATGETFLFWTELNGAQSQWGVYGQKFKSNGTRLWGDGGVVLVPLGSTEHGFVRNLQTGDGAMVFWVRGQAFVDQQVVATRVDTDGVTVWVDPMPLVASAVSAKSRLTVALNAGADAALVGWVDDRDDVGDVFGQNVNADGSLGVASIPGDLDGDGHVTITDFLALLAAWGPCDAPCPPSCVADLDGDCVVGIADFLALLANWG